MQKPRDGRRCTTNVRISIRSLAYLTKWFGLQGIDIRTRAELIAKAVDLLTHLVEDQENLPFPDGDTESVQVLHDLNIALGKVGRNLKLQSRVSTSSEGRSNADVVRETLEALEGAPK